MQLQHPAGAALVEVHAVAEGVPRAMPATNADLHGAAPDTAAVALIPLDAMSDLEVDVGGAPVQHALEIAARLAALTWHANRCSIPMIHANDTYCC